MYSYSIVLENFFCRKDQFFKDSSPGLWDSSCSGHLDTGENYDSAAVRELSEELGVNSEMELITMLKPTKKQAGSLLAYMRDLITVLLIGLIVKLKLVLF